MFYNWSCPPHSSNKQNKVKFAFQKTCKHLTETKTNKFLNVDFKKKS